MNVQTLLKQRNVNPYRVTTSHSRRHHHLCIDFFFFNLLYVLYIHVCILCILDHSLCICYDLDLTALRLLIQRAKVKDFKRRVRQLLKCAFFETYPAHASTRKRVIFIANVSSTMTIFVNICWEEKRTTFKKKIKLIYFILYTCRTFTNYFSKLMCLFSPFFPFIF